MKAILHDVTRCTGCMTCLEACARDNELYEDPAQARFDPGELDSHRYTTVERLSGRNVRLQCLHCVEPSCASACLVGALVKTPEGPVVYDASKCIGCRYCMVSCPYHAIRYEWKKTFPFVKKCDMCYDREGGPACAAACPHAATKYGDRDELLRIAHERIRKEPDRYIDRVWGETEAGGTCVMFLSDVSLDPLFPTALGETSIPDMTLPLAKTTPFLALGVASFLVGASWIIGRRNKLAEERAAEALDTEGGPDGGA